MVRWYLLDNLVVLVKEADRQSVADLGLISLYTSNTIIYPPPLVLRDVLLTELKVKGEKVPSPNLRPSVNLSCLPTADRIPKTGPSGFSPSPFGSPSTSHFAPPKPKGPAIAIAHRPLEDY